jgi:hypothetical protein
MIKINEEEGLFYTASMDSSLYFWQIKLNYKTMNYFIQKIGETKGLHSSGITKAVWIEDLKCILTLAPLEETFSL